MTMLEKYSKSIQDLKLSAIGTWNTPNGGSDPLPYSLDSYAIDEPGIKKLEGKFGKTRYQLGDLGGGSQNSPGYNPSKTWSDSTPRQ